MVHYADKIILHVCWLSCGREINAVLIKCQGSNSLKITFMIANDRVHWNVTKYFSQEIVHAIHDGTIASFSCLPYSMIDYVSSMVHNIDDWVCSSDLSNRVFNCFPWSVAILRTRKLEFRTQKIIQFCYSVISPATSSVGRV